MTRRKTQSSQLYEVVSGFRSSQETADNAASSSFSIDESSLLDFPSSQTAINNSNAVSHKAHKNLAGDGLGHVECENLSGSDGSGGKSLETTTQPTEGSSDIPTHEKDSNESSKDIGSSQVCQVATLKDASSQTLRTLQKPVSFSRRHSATFPIHQECSGDSFLATKSANPISMPKGYPSSPLKRTSSLIRLSMSIDGRARVITDTGVSPPRPRLRPENSVKPQNRSNNGLQRSQSAVEQNVAFPVFPKRSMTGRSRDARTWEFYCDGNAGNALTKQAEREQSGSAMGPISMIRSQNIRGVKTKLNTINTSAVQLESVKRSRPDGQLTNKPKLARAASSVARLQNVDGNIQKYEAISKDRKPKVKPQPALYEVSDGDSDKENWEPGTQSRRTRRRQITTPQTSSQTQHAVLEESSRIPSQSSSLDALMNRESLTTRKSSPRSKECHNQENVAPETNDEVSAFMNSSIVSRAIEDLEGVQNLLSLSKAAW